MSRRPAKLETPMCHANHLAEWTPLASNVGIAIGTAGTDIAIEASDVALMGSDLTAIQYFIRLGRRVVRKLQVNIAIALGAKALTLWARSWSQSWELAQTPFWCARKYCACRV